jgi:hypothetical protein
MRIVRVIQYFTIICLLSFACKEREPINPLDPDNPNTHGQAYTIQAIATGIGEVKLHWRKVNESKVKSYSIYRTSENEAYTRIGDAPDSLFLDTQLLPGKTYSYFYRLVWEDGREIHQSPAANVVTFNAPTGLTISKVTRNRIEMRWNNLSWLDNYGYCRIYCQSGGDFLVYDSTSSSQYADTNVEAGITYHYKLMAIGTDESQSNYSTEIHATPSNNVPVIDSLVASQPTTDWGGQVSITCYAHDNDGDSIFYSWKALDGGIIIVSGQTITFQVPQDAALAHRVKVTVTDSYSATDSSIIIIESNLPTRILVDASHDGGGWWFPQSETSGFSSANPHQGKALADYLHSRGFTVDELPRGITITDSILNRYSKIIRVDKYGSYSESELLAYDNFLKRSTSLLLISEYLRSGEKDELAERLGISLKGVAYGYVSRFAPHQITQGVHSFYFNAGSVVVNYNSNSSIEILGWLSDNSFVDFNDNGIQDPNEPNGPPVMGTLHHQNAKIFFLCDINGIETLTQPFVSNLVDWAFE